MHPVETYIRELRDIRATGAAVAETSYYSALANLLNAIGRTFKPPVRCVSTIKNVGAVPGVTMVAAPGESSGHCIVRIESDGKLCFLVGDLFHHACEVTHLDWISPGRDLIAMRASRERVIAEGAVRSATVVFTHAPFPGWGRIVPNGTDYRWEREYVA